MTTGDARRTLSEYRPFQPSQFQWNSFMQCVPGLSDSAQGPSRPSDLFPAGNCHDGRTCKIIAQRIPLPSNHNSFDRRVPEHASNATSRGLLHSPLVASRSVTTKTPFGVYITNPRHGHETQSPCEHSQTLGCVCGCRGSTWCSQRRRCLPAAQISTQIPDLLTAYSPHIPEKHPAERGKEGGRETPRMHGTCRWATRTGNMTDAGCTSRHD
jgi:hypothetical protein